MIDKALLSKLMLIFSVAISMIAVYMFISPYQNCKRDMVGSFEDAYVEDRFVCCSPIIISVNQENEFQKVSCTNETDLY